MIQPEELSALAGLLLSLGFSYLPGVSERFNTLAPTHKRLVMLGLLLGCTASIFALSCVQPSLTPGIDCNQGGAWGLLRVFVAALVANQAAFELAPRTGRKLEADQTPVKVSHRR